MGCTSAGPYDEETNRYSCQVTGDDCMYMSPSSSRCADDYNEGPDANIEGEE